MFIFTEFSLEISISSVDPDQKLLLAASDLGLHCLHNTPKWISGLKRVKAYDMSDIFRRKGLVCYKHKAYIRILDFLVTCYQSFSDEQIQNKLKPNKPYQL